MNELTTLWNRIEKRAIYIVMLLFIGLEFASFFIPSITSFIDTRGAITFMAVILILIFRYIDERLDTQSAIIPTRSFLRGITNLLSTKNEYDTADLFVHSGNIYYRAFLESGVKVKSVRIMFRNMENFSSMQFPADESDKFSIRSQLQRTLKDWEQLLADGKIETLEFSYYPFEPLIHYMILDSRQLFFGLYSLEHKFPGVGSRRRHAFQINAINQAGITMVDDFSSEFENIWNEFKN